VRDVAEDIERNRIYIPLEDLERFAVTEKMLRTGEINEEVRALLAFEIERARDYIREGEKLIDHLPRHARGCPMLLAAIYSRILDRIEMKGYDVFSARVSLSTKEKLILTFRTWVRAFLR
jgi:phytoene synthase